MCSVGNSKHIWRGTISLIPTSSCPNTCLWFSQYQLLKLLEAPIKKSVCPNTHYWNQCLTQLETAWRRVGDGAPSLGPLQICLQKVRHKGVAIELKMSVRVLWAIPSTFYVGRFVSFSLHHVPIHVFGSPNTGYWIIKSTSRYSFSGVIYPLKLCFGHVIECDQRKHQEYQDAVYRCQNTFPF